MGPVFFTHEDVRKAADGDDPQARMANAKLSLDMVEDSIRAMAAGHPKDDRSHVQIPPGVHHYAHGKAMLGAHLATMPGDDSPLVAFLVCIGNRMSFDKNGVWRLVWDPNTLSLVCILPDYYVQPWAVGGHAGVGTRWLAREDAKVLAIFGSSRHAYGALRANLGARDFDEVRIWSPTPENRKAFGERARRDFDINVVVSESAREAVEGADVISLATRNHPSSPPVFEAEWLSPGTHVNTIAYELGPEIIERARIVPQHTEELRVFPWEPYHSRLLADEIPNLGPDMYSMLSSGKTARASDDEITVYLADGAVVHSIAIVQWIYDEGRAKGLGHQLDIG